MKECNICNSILGNKIKVENCRTYEVCSKKCLSKLFNLKKVLKLVEGLASRYGSYVYISDVQDIMEGWIKKTQTKKYIRELILRGLIIDTGNGTIKLGRGSLDFKKVSLAQENDR
jgi:hypothetical protein